MKRRILAVARRCTPAAVFSCLFLLSVATVCAFLLRALRTNDRISSVADLPRTVAEICKKSFPGKNVFVAAGGLAARAIGRRMCNNRVLLRNGHIGFVRCHVGDVRGKAAREIAFSRFLARRGIPFLHVQAPTGLDLERMLVSPVCDCNANEKAEEFVAQLRLGGVDVIDLIPRFAATADDVTRNFLKTDHHWNYDAAFEASEILAEHLAEKLRLPVADDKDVLCRMEWLRNQRNQWRSGGHAYRTGPLFAGVDDISWHVLASDATFSRVMYDRNGVIHRKSGKFEDVFVNAKVVQSCNWFADSAYVVFSKIAFIAVFKNPSALADRTVLILGDSFARPVPAYLSKVFARVVIVDPRHFRECRAFKGRTLSALVSETRPDVVVQFMNPTSLGADMGDAGLGRAEITDRMFDYGLSDGESL